MLDSFASRLKTCRTMVGLKSKDIVKALNEKGLKFTLNQYSRWEVHVIDVDRLIRHEVVEHIVDILNEHGLTELSSEWLLYGTGPTPILVDLSTTPDDVIAFYLSRYLGESYRLITIIGSYAEPIAGSGEHIIIHYDEPKNLENRIVFITTKSLNQHVGVLENKANCVIINKAKESITVNHDDIDYCGRIVWVS